MATSGSYIAFGNESEFLSANGPVSTAMGFLTESKFVIVYQDNADSQHGTAKIGTISGSDVTFGSETEYFSLNFSNPVYVTPLSSSGFVVVYQDESDSGHGTARIGEVSGTTITFGPEFEYLSTGRAAFANVAALDSTHFVVGYSDQSDSSYGKVKIGTVTGTSISFGSAATLHSTGETEEIVLTGFGPSGFVAAYRESAAASLHGSARFGSVDGSTITLGAEEEFISVVNANPWSIAIDRLGTSGFIVAYRDSTDSNHGSVKIGEVSGMSITFGAEAEFLTVDGTAGNRVASLDASSFVIMYKDASDSNHGTAKIGTVDGTDVTFNDESEFLDIDGVNNLALMTVNPRKIVVAYTDTADSNHGTVKVGTIGFSASHALFIHGQDNINTSVNLYLAASVTGTPSDAEIPLRIIHRLTQTGDHNPQLISTFDNSPNNVNIQVWDVIDGQNTPVVIANSGCYAIGNTDKWGWSTEHLLFTSDHKKSHYYFRMISDNSEEQYGEFFITVPERGLWSHPN